MQWRHRSVRIALRDIHKKGVEIGERQNRCHDDGVTLMEGRLITPFSSFEMKFALMKVMCIE